MRPLQFLRHTPMVLLIAGCFLLVMFLTTSVVEEVQIRDNAHVQTDATKDARLLLELRKELEASIDRTGDLFVENTKKISSTVTLTTRQSTVSPTTKPPPPPAKPTTTTTTTKQTTTTTKKPEEANKSSSGWAKPKRNLTSIQTVSLDKEKLDRLEKRFVDRRRKMEETCNTYAANFSKPLNCELNTAKYNFKYVEKEHLLYCSIEKTGCTFWKRILHVIGGWGNTSNPTDIRSDLADVVGGGYRTLQKRNMSQVEEIFKNSTNIMFVRDPYTRIFSAWLDKFYSPNPYFWNVTGKQIIGMFRPKLDKGSPYKCGHDVSFTEFVSFLANKSHVRACLDGHFAPNYKHCLQCSDKHKYQYIGKYESIKDDTFYLLNKLNQTDTVKFSHFEKDAAYDAIFDLTNWVFTEKARIQKCGVTFRCALFKTWKRLQSRGFIGKESPFPYKTDEEVDSLKAESVINDMLEANKNGNKTQMKHNRIEALVKAIKSLPNDVLDEYKEGYKIDFKMFDYPVEPDYLKIDDSELDQFNFFERCPES